jgi:hypothetical protein
MRPKSYQHKNEKTVVFQLKFYFGHSKNNNGQKTEKFSDYMSIEIYEKIVFRYSLFECVVHVSYKTTKLEKI